MSFHWRKVPQEALDKVKDALRGELVLQIFDGTKPVQVATEASNAGLGAVLLQDGCWVHYVSRSLLPAEKNYSAMEKELLGVLPVVFAMERLHFHIAGREVEVITDHKPLVSLSNEESGKVSPRFVKFLDRLLLYVLSWTYIWARIAKCATRLSQR